MNRAPLIASFLLFLALVASLAYWAMHLLAPPPRPVSATPQVSEPASPIAAAADIFGGRGGGNTMMNVQLRGVVLAGRPEESVAILAAEGNAPRSLRVNAEVLPGVTVLEIHPRYVVLSDHGALREVGLPDFAASGAVDGGASGSAAAVNNDRVPIQQAPEVSSGASGGAAVTGNAPSGGVNQQGQIQGQPQTQPQTQPQPGTVQPPASSPRQEFPQPAPPAR